MAMSFPAKRVRMEIVEGLANPQVLRLADGWVSLQVSSRHMDDYHICRQVMETLAKLLRSTAPQGPQWEEDVRRINDAFAAHHAHVEETQASAA